MKRTKIIPAVAAFIGLIAALALFAAQSNSGSNSKLNWRSFNEGLDEAKQSNKKILIDVYTDWCGWCKRMDSQTYSNALVTKVLEEKFVLIKLNAESDKKLSFKGQEYTEQELASAFGITGYPSTIFLTADAEPITVYPGYADAVKFEQVLSFISNEQYKTKKSD